MQGFSKKVWWGQKCEHMWKCCCTGHQNGVYSSEKEAGPNFGGSVNLLLFFHPVVLIKPAHVVYRDTMLHGVCVCVGGSFIDLIAPVSPSTSYICSHLLVNLPHLAAVIVSCHV